MDNIAKFKAGDQVHLIQDIIFAKRNKQEIPVQTVINPQVPTDMLRVVTDEPVNFYVELDDGTGKTGQYHQQNLVGIYDFDHNTTYVGI